MNITRQSIVCERAVIADRPLARLRGLMGRSAMPAGEGLLLQPAPSVHTAFMRFPIDVLFLDSDLNVLKSVEALKPWRAAAARKARATLELPAGALAAREVRVGDRLALIEPSESARAEEVGGAMAADRTGAGVSLTSAAREAACIDGLQPALGIVVGNEPQDSLVAKPVRAQWGSIDALYEATVMAGRLPERGS